MSWLDQGWEELYSLFDKEPPETLIKLIVYHHRTIKFLETIEVQMPRNNRLRKLMEKERVVACLELNKTLEKYGLICGRVQWAVKRLDCLTEAEKHYLRNCDYWPYKKEKK